jgi:Predicted membrane protein (DUF2232)
MVQIVFIGIAAGAAAALLFASVVSGSLLSVALFYLAPLPLLIAALGWSHVAGLVAALVAAASLAAVFGPFLFLAFMLGVGLPAWWLGYLALLARQVATPSGEALEWYPVGRLVWWAAILGALVVIVAIPNFGLDAESFRGALRRTFERILRMQTGDAAGAPLSLPGIADPNRLLNILVTAIPPAAAVLSTLTSLANLWLAGVIVRASGRLKRPWPNIPAMTFPPYAPMLLAFAVAGTFLPDLPGIVSGILGASLLLAYTLLGLAVLHAITLGLSGRALMLTGAYFAIGLFGWPIVLMAAVGLVETMFAFRDRLARKRGPPTAPV